ncbi:ABC transporter permease [Paracoccus rhizosphaerae]|uniref:ABC transporter permease n=1 Tax=Paracoccus rhizosphaerae TaxID=1133347 RepID=A0ABV6CJN5_9RHOB|nr:ABC transporter [Paracoccus rhizosphaerae]
MFTQRRNSNMVQAAGTTLALIYHQTVYNLRFSHRSALFGLLAIILQSAVFIIILLALYTLIGIRNSPIRGDFMLYIMSGIFIYMTHVQTATAVAGSHSLASGVVKHEPLNAAVLIAGAACAMLYRQLISCLVILSIYHLAFQPITIYDPVGAMALLLLSWFSGITVGMVFLGIKPWSPAASRGLATFYQRVNMFASGKMFVANTLPNFILPWFIWNPLFHLIDQERGFLFINYSPHKTWLLYPLWVTLACFMVALLINFTTRKYESVSWSAVQ